MQTFVILHEKEKKRINDFFGHQFTRIAKEIFFASEGGDPMAAFSGLAATRLGRKATVYDAPRCIVYIGSARLCLALLIGTAMLCMVVLIGTMGPAWRCQLALMSPWPSATSVRSRLPP